jgi:DNA-binding LytR/AlgR family response regulator
MDAENTLLACGAKSVDTVATAEDAIQLLQATAPDVCVLDVNLGSGNSLAVAELLIKRGIPFIFATGYADSAIIPRTMAHVPTVRKPYDAESLKTAIAKAMKRGDADG